MASAAYMGDVERSSRHTPYWSSFHCTPTLSHLFHWHIIACLHIVVLEIPLWYSITNYWDFLGEKTEDHPNMWITASIHRRPQQFTTYTQCLPTNTWLFTAWTHQQRSVLLIWAMSWDFQHIEPTFCYAATNTSLSIALLHTTVYIHYTTWHNICEMNSGADVHSLWSAFVALLDIICAATSHRQYHRTIHHIDLIATNVWWSFIP